MWVPRDQIQPGFFPGEGGAWERGWGRDVRYTLHELERYVLYHRAGLRSIRFGLKIGVEFDNSV